MIGVNMRTALALLAYAASMVAANFSVAHFGPWVSPLSAFLLIGLDLSLRDWLHGKIRAVHMGALIVGTSGLTYVLNPAAGRIAAASAAAFLAAALADWLVFSRVTARSRLLRSNASNAAGAALDSLVFPLAAGFPLALAPAQFVAKVVGGAIWARLLFGRNDQ